MIAMALAEGTVLAQGAIVLQHTGSIPPALTKAFAAQFPTSHLKKWEKDSAGYLAIFKQKGEKCTARYTTGGLCEATESPVKWTRNLPEAVRAGWNKSKYMDWLILDMKKIVQPAQTLYAIHVGQVQSLGPDDADIGSEYILFFSERGDLIKTEPGS